MARDCDDSGLFLYLFFFKKLSNLDGGLISIHERHVAVHQDEFESMGVAFIEGSLDDFDCLFPIVCKLGNGLTVCHAKHH
jgi:hypothetical protein